jgi:hypothetical protein
MDRPCTWLLTCHAETKRGEAQQQAPRTVPACASANQPGGVRHVLLYCAVQYAAVLCSPSVHDLVHHQQQQVQVLKH